MIEKIERCPTPEDFEQKKALMIAEITALNYKCNAVACLTENGKG